MNTFHNTWTLFLLSFLCLLSAVTLSTARPTLEQISESLSILGPRQLQTGWFRRSPETSVRALSAMVIPHSSEKRTPPSFSFQPHPVKAKMRQIAFTSMGMLTPVATAAQALQEFYRNIAINAGSIWKTEPLRDTFSIVEGSFRLSFTSMGDTIPWEFVEQIAERLWCAASRGLTDLFDVIYTHETQQIAVMISMRIAEDSSSSSDTDYREGSVPSVTSP